MIAGVLRLTLGNIGTFCRLPMLFGGAMLLASCSITRNVPDGRYLLNKSEIELDSKELKKGDLTPYLKQQPNRKILGFRFHLRLYNLASPGKFSGIHRALKTNGEEPTLLDTNLVRDGAQNVLLYLKSKGYYNATVSDTIRYSAKRANVLYRVSPSTPYRVNSLTYSIEDTVVRRLVRVDSAGCLIARGQRFDTDIFQSERLRLETYLRNNGFYTFNREFVTFLADTTTGGHRVDVVLAIRNASKTDSEGRYRPEGFRRFRVKRVFVYPNYDPVQSLPEYQNATPDTVEFNGLHYICRGDPGVKLGVIHNATAIRPGVMYSGDMVSRSQNNLNQLRLYRYVNISFSESRADAENSPPHLLAEQPANADTALFGHLDCHIHLSYSTLQNYQTELVGTNTTGSLGAEGNFTYQHKNLFRGAEVFDIKLRGMVESAQQKLNLNNTLELGGSMGLSVPKFLGPFSSHDLIIGNAVKSQVTASYSFQRRPNYTRTLASLVFGYSWKSSRYITQNLNPIEINVIQIPRIRDEFQQQIESTFLKYSYISQQVTVSSYGITFNNQNVQRTASYTYMRYNLELSGNLLYLASAALGREKAGDGSYQLLNTSFSQFVRSDINLSYHQVVDQNNTFVYRVFAGIGYPYGNSKALPFEKMYFSGGANGVRAWQARALGPGSYFATGESFPDRTADIKLEANLEYRFKVFWLLEGALFLDAGNIWSLPGVDTRKGAIFDAKEFYRQIALGSGIGIRVNFGFVTVRTDFGYKVYDPAKNPEGEFSPWVLLHQKFMLRNFNINFGIGYPF